MGARTAENHATFRSDCETGSTILVTSRGSSQYKYDLSWYGYFHFNYKTSYRYNGYSYAGKTAAFYWDGHGVLWLKRFNLAHYRDKTIWPPSFIHNTIQLRLHFILEWVMFYEIKRNFVLNLSKRDLYKWNRFSFGSRMTRYCTLTHGPVIFYRLNCYPTTWCE